MRGHDNILSDSSVAAVWWGRLPPPHPSSLSVRSQRGAFVTVWQLSWLPLALTPSCTTAFHIITSHQNLLSLKTWDLSIKGENCRRNLVLRLKSVKLWNFEHWNEAFKLKHFVWNKQNGKTGSNLFSRNPRNKMSHCTHTLFDWQMTFGKWNAARPQQQALNTVNM